MSTQTATLTKAQGIAQSIVGAVDWRGAQGFCTCPGIGRHTTRNAPGDCKVVAEPISTGGGTLAPGCYCFHGSCRGEVDAASYALRSALGKRSPSTAPRIYAPSVRKIEPTFDKVKLARIAAKLDGADEDWFAARSPIRPGNRTPASFLHALYEPGEKVVIFDVFESQGQAVWTCKKPPFDARELNRFTTGKRNGVWFLCNPVTGDYTPNDTGKPSRRSWQNVTSWKYLVLESDEADPAHWLATLAQMPLPIAAIYESGGKSSHALIKLNAESKEQWDDTADQLKPMLITLGADRRAISAVRLTRLPCCQRLGTTDESGTYHQYPEPRLQKLIYLSNLPDLTPICEQRVIRPGWAEWLPADQDGFNSGELQ